MLSTHYVDADIGNSRLFELAETVLASPATATTSMNFLFSRPLACVYMTGRPWRQDERIR
jgi:hypothetical protein